MTGALILQSIKNLSASVDLLSNKQPKVEVTEVGPQTVVFTIPAQARTGQLVELGGRLTVDKQGQAFSATGRIVNVTPVDGKMHRFEIYLQQYDQQAWARFLKSAQAKQTHADKIFNAIRGDGDT